MAAKKKKPEIEWDVEVLIHGRGTITVTAETRAEAELKAAREIRLDDLAEWSVSEMDAEEAA